MTQIEYFGIDALLHLEEILCQERPARIFLVHGKRSYHLSGAAQKISHLLKGYDVHEFTDFAPNPKLEDIQRGLKAYQDSGGGLILAVGGGSVIDVSKAINYFSNTDTVAAEEALAKPPVVTGSLAPLVAVPTTSGSGSEATQFAVVYSQGKKYSLDIPIILPKYAIIDPTLTYDLNPRLTAVSGMDALAQAIESFWAVRSTPHSQQLSEEAIKIICSNLKAAVNRPTLEARVNMAKAANLAGKAINITRTTACHALSYPLTSGFGIPHGHAVSLTLGSMMVYNSQVNEEDCTDPRGAEYVKTTMNKLLSILNVSTCQQAEQKITAIMQGIGLATNLKALSLPQQCLDAVMRDFNPERMKNNPRRLPPEKVRAMLMQIY